MYKYEHSLHTDIPKLKNVQSLMIFSMIIEMLVLSSNNPQTTPSSADSQPWSSRAGDTDVNEKDKHTYNTRNIN